MSLDRQISVRFVAGDNARVRKRAVALGWTSTATVRHLVHAALNRADVPLERSIAEETSLKGSEPPTKAMARAEDRVCMQVMRGPYGRIWPLDDVLLCVPIGWRPLVKRLIGDLFALGWDGNLGQVKEKFGGLRFYTGGCTPEMYALIAFAEAESFTVCDRCGRPGKLRERYYWVATLCTRHCAAYYASQFRQRCGYRWQAFKRWLSLGLDA